MHEAMDRHPTAWRPKPALLRTRMAELLEREGAEHPEVGARAIATRGALRLDRRSFGALFGVDEPTVEALEAGTVDWVNAPRALLAFIVGADRKPDG